MIEFCTRKKMVLAIVVLVSLTVVTLIAEGMWSTKHKLIDINDNNDSTACGDGGEEKVITECQPCSSFEKTRGVGYCTQTGYKEEVQCAEGKSFLRSCKVDPWAAERKFWILQLVTCLVGLGSYGIVKFRQSKNDRMLMDKVNRQIAA